MRISDWSSDVCSSDLAAATGHHVGDRDDAEQVEVLLPRGNRAADGEGEGAGHVEQGEQQQFLVHRSALRALGMPALSVARPEPCGAGTTDIRSGKLMTPPSQEQIGRASCRERGVQYV